MAFVLSAVCSQGNTLLFVFVSVFAHSLEAVRARWFGNIAKHKVHSLTHSFTSNWLWVLTAILNKVAGAQAKVIQHDGAQDVCASESCLYSHRKSTLYSHGKGWCNNSYIVLLSMVSRTKRSTLHADNYNKKPMLCLQVAKAIECTIVVGYVWLYRCFIVFIITT